MWVTHRSLLPRLPWNTWLCPSEDRVRRWHDCLGWGKLWQRQVHGKARSHRCNRSGPSAWWPAQEGQPSWGLFLAPGGTGGWCMEREATMVAPPLQVTQQWCLASMAVWVSSRGIPSYEYPPSHPLRLSPQSQQQSYPRVCCPMPMFQLSGSMCTSRHKSQSGACSAVVRTICVGLTLSCLPQTGCFTLLLQPQMLPFCPN